MSVPEPPPQTPSAPPDQRYSARPMRIALTAGEASGAPSAGATQGHGSAISSDGDLVFVGAPLATEAGNAKAGRVNVYRVDDRWGSATATLGDVTATALLTNVGGDADDEFGAMITLGGGSGVVGAPKEHAGGTDSGRVDVFKMDVVFKSGFER